MRAFLKFRSRVALWVLRILLSLALIGSVAYAIYWVGGCEGGFKEWAECSEMPDAFGQAMFVAWNLSALFIYFVGKWIALLALLWEAIARMYWKA
jgi:hypothetical protein